MREYLHKWGNQREQKSERGERLWERAVDKKERLVQTYVVLYSLLITCGRINLTDNVPTVAVRYFFPFLVVVLIYYMILSRMTYDEMYDDKSPWYAFYLIFMEFCSIFTSYFLSYAVISYLVMISFTDPKFSFYYSGIGFYSLVFILFFVIFRTLSVLIFNTLFMTIDLITWLYNYVFRAS